MDTQTFADRLRQLIGERSVNAFAHLVGLNESLLRKYLKGADPGLARANQIAERANCSLEWLREVNALWRSKLPAGSAT